MAEATEQSIVVECTCGKKLKAPASAVGRKARCKACGTILTIGASNAPAVASASAPARPKTARPASQKPRNEPAEDDDPLGALYDLAKEERNTNNIIDEPRCPQCMSILANSAVICTTCGFNVKTGKAMKTVTDTPKAAKKPLFGMGTSKPTSAPSGKQVDDAMAPQGSFMLGVGGSIAGGIVGAVIWFLIAHFTGFEVGFVAIGVGALAGLGMQIGQKGYSKLGGVVAALVAFLAILSAKAAVFAAIIMGSDASTPSMAELDDYDERVVEMLMREELARKGLDYDETDEEDDEKAAKVVSARLAKMSPSEINALVAKAEAQEARDELTGYLADEKIRAKEGSTGQEADFDDYIRASKEAETQVAAMNDAQVTAELTKQRDAEDAAMAAEEQAARAHAEATGESYDDDSKGGSNVVAFAIGALLLYIIFGGLWSLIFMILAVSVAYKTASGAAS